MTTIAQIRNDPSYLGDDATSADAEQFIAAVEIVMAAGVEESRAADIVWGSGDYIPRMQAILENGYTPG